MLDYACFANHTGYGSSALDNVAALNPVTDLRVSLYHNNPAAQAESTRHLIDALKHKPVNLRATRIYHCIPTMIDKFPRLKRNIGYAIYEATKPPQEWIRALNTLDAVICPSQFCLSHFSESGVTKPIYLIPHVINAELYHPGVKTTKDDTFTFLYMGTWRNRKGVRELLTAFLQEFTTDDKVVLRLKTDKTQAARQWASEIRCQLNLTSTPEIVTDDQTRRQDELPALISNADAVVLPQRGEGFSLVALQTLALGVPLITTRYSGVLEFASDDNSTLITPTEWEKGGMDGVPQFHNQHWPKIPIPELRQAMRNVHQNKLAEKEKALKASTNIRERFGYDTARTLFTMMMQEIEEGMSHSNVDYTPCSTGMKSSAMK